MNHSQAFNFVLINTCQCSRLPYPMKKGNFAAKSGQKMKIKLIICTILVALSSINADAARKTKTSKKRSAKASATKKAPAKKSTQSITVREIITEDTDENEDIELSFFEKAWLNVRDESPFAYRPTFTAEELRLYPLAVKMTDFASRYLGTRYKLGATGPSAFDCSGFTGWIYRHFGMNLERTSRSQFTQGRKVELHELQPGDLLFFSSRSSGPRTVGHVAMVVSVNAEDGTCEFIHASTRRGVTYQSFPDNAYYSKHFLGARRMLGTEVSATASL